MSQKRNQNLKKNLIFTAAVLLAAAALGGYYLVRQANRTDYHCKCNRENKIDSIAVFV